MVAGGLACTAWRGAIGVYWFREWLEIIPTVFGLAIASIGIALLRRR